MRPKRSADGREIVDLDAESAIQRIRELEAEIEIARVNAIDSEQQIDRARQTIDDLAAQVQAAARTVDDLQAQIDRAREERRQLVATAGRWRRRARNRWAWLARPFVGRWKSESVVPPHIMEARRKAGLSFLRGRGIEIGALHSPIPHGWRARVRYVDRMSTDELYAHYTEFGDADFVHVNVVDDGEVLARFPDGSLDFIVASHMLEHCENPLGTMRNHLAKLRAGGRLLYIVPEQHAGCDIDRPVTAFEHLIRDDTEGPESSRWEHYLEFALLADKVPPDEADEMARRMMEDGSSIHFHVWDEAALREFFERAADHLDVPYEIEHFQLNHVELIVVLRA